MKNFFFLIAFFTVSSVYCQQDSAFSFRQDAAHNGIYPSKNYAAFGNLLLKFKTGGKIFSSPLVSNGFVYIGSEDGNLYAINTHNKKQAWKFSTGGPVYSSPAVFRHVVYFASYDGYFYAVDGISGKEKWKFKTDGEKKAGAKGLWTMKPVTEYMEDPFDFFLSSPVIGTKDNLVYFGSGDGSVYALQTDNGKLLWKFETKGIVHSSPVLYNGNLYIGSWDQYLYAIDAKTGKEKWKFKTGEDTVYHLLEGIQASPAIYNDAVYFGARDGYFYALDATTGTLKWRYSANNSWILTSATFKDNTVYIGTSDTYQFIALDAITGKEKFKAQADGYVYSSPSIAGHTAYFGDFSGQLFAVDLNENGKISDKFITDSRRRNAGEVLLKDKIDFAHAANGLDLSLYSSTIIGMNKLYSLGPILSSPVIYQGVIYFGGADGNLYGLKLKENKGDKDNE
jgi:outer membrane protein assembly factor BamB